MVAANPSLTPPTPTDPPARAQFPPLGVALSLFSEAVAHRSELATIELHEAREHAAGSVLRAGIVAALVLFTGFAITLLVASLVWDQPHRGWWLGGLCAAYLAAALGTGFALSRRLRDWQPMAETQRQLQQDHQCLSHLIKSATQ